PRFNGQNNINLTITGLFEKSNDIRTFSYRRLEAAAQISQRISKATTFFYRYSWRHVLVDENTLKITPLLIPLLSQPVRVGSVSFAMIQDRRDDPLDPHRGVFNTLDIGLAHRFLGSQRDFIRFLARNATYHALNKRLVLARSTQFGDMHAFNYS